MEYRNKQEFIQKINQLPYGANIVIVYSTIGNIDNLFTPLASLRNVQAQVIYTVGLSTVKGMKVAKAHLKDISLSTGQSLPKPYYTLIVKDDYTLDIDI